MYWCCASSHVEDDTGYSRCSQAPNQAITLTNVDCGDSEHEQKCTLEIRRTLSQYPGMTNEILTTKDVAKQLKLTPRTLRVYLRKINGKAPGVKYEWSPDDAFLKKLPELIAAEKAKYEKAKADAAPPVIATAKVEEAKPAPKPAVKKAKKQ